MVRHTSRHREAGEPLPPREELLGRPPSALPLLRITEDHFALGVYAELGNNPDISMAADALSRTSSGFRPYVNPQVIILPQYTARRAQIAMNSKGASFLDTAGPKLLEVAEEVSTSPQQSRAYDVSKPVAIPEATFSETTSRETWTIAFLLRSPNAGKASRAVAARAKMRRIVTQACEQADVPPNNIFQFVGASRLLLAVGVTTDPAPIYNNADHLRGESLGLPPVSLGSIAMYTEFGTPLQVQA